MKNTSVPAKIPQAYVQVITKYCQCYNHTTESVAAGQPGKHCKRLAHWLVNGWCVCNKHKDGLTQQGASRVSAL